MTIDFDRKEANRAGQPVKLAARELSFLRHLVEPRGKVVTRKPILASVCQDQPYIGARTMDTHIAWLRQKLEENPQPRRHIVTARGEGYCFEPGTIWK